MKHFAAVLYIAAEDGNQALDVAARIEKLFRRTTDTIVPWVYVGQLEPSTEEFVDNLVVRRHPFVHGPAEGG